MKITVIEGNALEVRGIQALVVPANRQLTLGWGSHLAEKVLTCAGREVQDEALQQYPGGVALGDAVLTGSGKLEGFTHLIHAAVLDKYDFNPLFLLRIKERTDRKVLARAVRSSLEAASSAGLSSIVFTPMGAGIGGMADRVCARITLDEIRAFAESHKSSPLGEAVIACFEKRTAEAFRKELGRGSTYLTA